jgi:hypothetical protein
MNVLTEAEISELASRAAHIAGVALVASPTGYDAKYASLGMFAAEIFKALLQSRVLQ